MELGQHRALLCYLRLIFNNIIYIIISVKLCKLPTPAKCVLLVIIHYETLIHLIGIINNIHYLSKKMSNMMSCLIMCFVI